MIQFKQFTSRLLVCLLLAFFANCNTSTTPSLSSSDRPLAATYLVNHPDQHQLRDYLHIFPDSTSTLTIADITQSSMQSFFKTRPPNAPTVHWKKN